MPDRTIGRHRRSAAHPPIDETLLDRTLLRVDAETFARFVELLDAPSRPNERLRRLMQSRAPWE